MIAGMAEWPCCSTSMFALTAESDAGNVVSCKCALMETLWDYCPGQTRPWWQSTAQIGTKMLYLPGPDPKLWVVPVSHIIGRLPLVPASDHGTIPHDMHANKQDCFEYGTCDAADGPGTGSPLFYINSWGMIWPSDHPVLNA
jgi:hypothetical protein